MYSVGQLAPIVDAFCVSVVLAKTGDADKCGVGYFQLDDCDNNWTVCEFSTHPKYEYLQEAYTTTRTRPSSTTATRRRVIRPYLECTITLPVCNGVKANSYEHLSPSTAFGEKRKPSNTESSEIATRQHRRYCHGGCPRCASGHRRCHGSVHFVEHTTSTPTGSLC
uniref:Uncharacterized protein n=1 Tax=Hyaloperonospora arabidopsidis (strain Emoy2) TaxID=559515 RepID=M4B6G1_HYAAE